MHNGKTGLRLDPNPTPTAYDDNGADGQLYIAYESVPGPRPFMMPDMATLNVAADAGVLFNDDPGTATSVSAELDATTSNGSLQLNADGSFSYTPDVNFVGADTFTYHLRYGPNPGDVSNTATVTIGVMGYQPQAFPAGLGYSQKALVWPKMHYDVLNTGGVMYPWRSESSLIGESIAPEPDPIHHPVHYMGSPIITLIPDQGDFGYLRPVVFVESNQGLYAVNINQDLNPPALSPSLRWVNRDVWHADVPGQEVHSAPMIGYSDEMPDPNHQVIVMGNPLGQMVAIDAFNGQTVATFTAQETFDGFTSGGGPIVGSPTLSLDPEKLLIFGTNGTQVVGPNGPGASHGSIYALRPDGSVKYKDLLAGPVENSPMMVPRNPYVPGNYGAIYVGTAPNDWTGHPGTFGSSEGRFYKLDLNTVAVLAEAFVPGAVAQSATGIPDMSGFMGDWESPNARIYVTTTTGQIIAFAPTPVAPASPYLSPTLPIAWNVQGTAFPTTPALSPDFSAIYVGMTGQALKLDAQTGAILGTITFSSSAREAGSFSVGIDPIRSANSGEDQWNVYFGTFETGPYPTNFYVVDGRTFGVENSAGGPAGPNDGFVGAAALGMPDYQFDTNTKIYTTTENGWLVTYR